MRSLCLVRGYVLLSSKVKDGAQNVHRNVSIQLIAPLFERHQEKQKYMAWVQMAEEVFLVSLLIKNKAYFRN
jgi:hypothetical protein